MKLDTAINHLKRNYDLALKNDYVKDKVAWSLYKTWREVDRARRNKEYKEQMRGEEE